MRRLTCAILFLFVGLDGGMIEKAAAAPCVAPEIASFTPPDPLPYGNFGVSVAICGDTFVVGDNRYNSDVGIAHVYERNDGNWEHVAPLSLDASEGLFKFGYSVAVASNTIIVGAPVRYGISGGLDGAAIVFCKIDGIWREVQRLTRPDSEPYTLFGISVAVRGDTVIVGAMHDNEDGVRSGAAFVFRRSGGVFVFSQKLTVGLTSVWESLFGHRVALDNGVAVIGAYGSDIDGRNSGAAYVFRDTNGQFQLERALRPQIATAGSEFGYSVAVNGDRIVVGARSDRGNTPNTGTAYVFKRHNGQWLQLYELTPQDDYVGYFYGYSVALDGDTAVVGNPYAGDVGSSSGAAYVFREVANQWRYVGRLGVTGPRTSVELGTAVAVSQDTVISSDPYTDRLGGQGAVYVYDVQHDNIPADLNADGLLDSIDLAILVNVLLGADVDPAHVLRADVNCSNAVDGNDVQALVSQFTP